MLFLPSFKSTAGDPPSQLKQSAKRPLNPSQQWETLKIPLNIEFGNHRDELTTVSISRILSPSSDLQ
ncbi:hypothetical protein Ddc_05769 [Ditylenchus destructor]|nr:hypothetical protein Ddc_05769 [Ditylenchus destructor]